MSTEGATERVRVALCPEHFKRLMASDAQTLDPLSHQSVTTPMLRCAVTDCLWTYSLASGYFRFLKNEPIRSERSLWHVCPSHHRPLHISNHESEHEIAIWQCPEEGCKTSLRKRCIEGRP